MRMIVRRLLSGWFAAVLLCVWIAISASRINIHRLWQYDLGYYDFGMFAVPLWKAAHGMMPVIDHFRVSGKINFADHFNPSLFVLSPLFWFTDRMEVLLIAQSVIAALGGLFLFAIGKKLLKSALMSCAVMTAYFFFIGMQNALYSDFHELTVASAVIMAVYAAIIFRKKQLYFLLLIFLLGFKESLFQLGLGISVFVFLYEPKWRKTAILTGIISLFWGWGSIALVRYLSGGTYFYYEAQKSLTAVMQQLVTPPIKIRTVFWSFLSFGFLPILTPEALPIMLFHYAHRFLVESSTRWDLGLHYNAEIAPTLAVSAVIGLSRLKRIVPLKRFSLLSAFLLIVLTLGLHRFVFHGPLALAWNPVFIAHTNDFAFLDNLIAAVPKEGRLAVQNNLAPSFFTREVYILRDDYLLHNPDYIVIDARNGQVPSNYLGVKNIERLVARLITDTRFRVYYQDGDQYIFEKIRN